MDNLAHMLYENLQFLNYMIQNDYDKDIISDYISYNLDMIQNAKDAQFKEYQDTKIEKLKEEQSHRLDNLVEGGLDD